MKRILAIVLLVAMFASLVLLTGCSEVRKCEMCGQEKECSEVEVSGEDLWVCESCEAGVDALGELGNLLG